MALKISKQIDHEKCVQQFYDIYFKSKHSYEVRYYSTITAFDDSICLILKQFSKYYLSVFPTEKKLNDLCKRLETNPSKVYDLRIRNDYVVNICLHIVRCIDYLYVSALYRNKKLFNMYKSHSLLCRTIQQFFKEHCKQSKVSDDEITISCNIQKLHIVLGEIMYFEKITDEESLKYQENTGYQSNATKFVKLEFELMSDIDWTETFFNDSARYNIFKQTPTQKVERLNHQTLCDKINLEKSLKKHSHKYSKSIETNKCAPLLLTKFRSTSDEVKNLIIYSLQRLEEYFIFMLQSSNKTMYQLNKDQMDQNVLSPFKKLCGDVPEVLLYIHEHQTNDPIDLTLFNLFLSLCGNNMDFIDLRCPAKYGGEFDSILLYQEKCIMEAIRVKLLWNFYVRNETILEIDEFTTNSEINTQCSELNYKYIKDISTTITEFYTKKGNEVIIWTTYDWLSLKYLLTEVYEDNIDINGIKFNKMDIENVQFTFSEIYYYFLPLNANITKFLFFQNIILCNYLDEIMNMYVYRHAITIVVYFENRVYDKKNEIKISSLRNSLMWYEKSRYKFFLSLTLKCETKDSVLKIITAINKFKKNSDYLEIRNNIPSPAYVELFNAIKSKVFSSDKNESFYRTLKENCLIAIDFVSKFVDIVRKSIKVINPSNSHYDSNIDELPCHDLTYSPK
ncbi:Hypothetical protein CINCED_3A025559 [Cinara cedri]|nr:Hypothetical protein CINCED_3A025559 [Cinara cedri]